MTVENRISSVFNDSIDDIFDKGHLSHNPSQGRLIFPIEEKFMLFKYFIAIQNHTIRISKFLMLYYFMSRRIKTENYFTNLIYNKTLYRNNIFFIVGERFIVAFKIIWAVNSFPLLVIYRGCILPIFISAQFMTFVTTR